MKIEQWPLDRLRPHPENSRIFGEPEDSEEFDSIKADIKRRGIEEPLRVMANGCIISGHLRREVAEQLGMKTVPVIVVEPFADYRAELEALIKSNTERRQLTKRQIAFAYDALKNTPRAQGGTKGKPGAPKGNQNRKGGGKVGNNGGSSATVEKARDAAASALGVGTHEARALETVFLTPGVPKEVQDAVNRGEVKPTPVARAIREEVKAHGEVKHPARLLAVVGPKAKKPAHEPASSDDHETRLRHEVEAFKSDFKELLSIYTRLNAVLGRRPLKDVRSPDDHLEWLGLCRDIARRAWAEVESVQGPTNAGRQMSLTVINGGGK